MPDELQLLLTGFALGISIAAPPGPVTALAAAQVASKSWLSGWLVTAGATTADVVFFVLTYFGIARNVTLDERGALFLGGGILMLYLSYSTLARARRPVVEARGPPRTRSPSLLGLGMGLTNPFQLGWWVAVGAGMVAEFGLNIAAGFFMGIVGWTLVFTAAVSTGVARYRRLAPSISYASAALMAAFGVWFLVEGALTLFP